MTENIKLIPCATNITFNEILQVWKDKLWISRKSKINPMSSMMYLGGHNMDIHKLYEPTFFGLFNNDQLIAVNSGHKTSDLLYRSRGLYVDPLYRGEGLASILFASTRHQAIKEGCTHIWSLPRKSALYAYTNNEYIQTSDWIEEGVEFGPNCYVLQEVLA